MRGICVHCKGPVESHPKYELMWFHDNTDGAYGGQQITHEAEPALQFLVPIRYWERTEPTGVFVLRIDPDADSYDPTAAYAYAYHPGYGHNVYLRKMDLFPTRALALREAERRTLEREVEIRRQVEKMKLQLSVTR
jgi:hypothetical protein